MDAVAAPSWTCIERAKHAYEPSLRTWLGGMGTDASVVDDVIQDVWLRAMEHQRTFCSLSYTKAWLFRVAHNLVIDQWRSAKTYPLDVDLLEEIPLAETKNHALERCLTHRLALLKAEDRTILEACELGGMRLNDYARIHDLSLSAAKSRLARARKRLRKALEQGCAHALEADNR